MRGVTKAVYALFKEGYRNAILDASHLGIEQGFLFYLTMTGIEPSTYTSAYPWATL